MRVFLVFFLLSICSVLSAQEDTTVYELVDQEAEFPGGTAEMMKWIQSNLVYPTINENDLQLSSKIYIEFIVEKDGSLQQIMVKTKCEPYRESAFNLMKTSPNWIPAKLNNSKVRSLYRIPLHIDFN